MDYELISFVGHVMLHFIDVIVGVSLYAIMLAGIYWFMQGSQDTDDKE
jgi:hypothetical protein